MSLWGDDSPLGAFAARRQEADADADGEAKGPGTRQRPLTVSEAVRAAKQVLERHLGAVWVEGETLSVKRPSSGHLYFVLKDGTSQINVVMWRSEVQRLRFRIEDGQTLRCGGQMTIYERDGRFQLYARQAEPAGLGAEALALEQLKRRLAAEGLFDPARKRPLPLLPRRIGVVTSTSGAAVRDIIRTVHRRFPVPILIADTSVQGAAAPRQIAAAIRALGHTDVDVIIVGRGGGSAADLAAFNDELVVRAIAACRVPTVSAVGHEIDISLADLVADERAETPTAAAERVVPVLADLAVMLAKEERRLHREMLHKVQASRQELDQLVMALGSRTGRRIGVVRQELGELRRRLENQHPRARMLGHRSELERLGARMHELARRRLDGAARQLAQLDAELGKNIPRTRISAYQSELTRLEARMHEHARRRVDLAGREFLSLVTRLEAMSPLAVLKRGYAIARRGERVLSDARAVHAGDEIHVRLARGSLDCRVERAHLEGGPSDESTRR